MLRHICAQGEEGFTLIEVMVALTILAIGIASLSAVFPLAMKDITESGSASRATQLCQQKVEDLHMLPFDADELTAGSTHADSLNPIGGIYDRTWDVTDDSPISGCKLIEVTVSWAGGGARSVSMATVLAQAGR